MHLQERLLGPALRPALPEGLLRRGLQAGVPALHLGLRHVRLPDRAVRVRARLHRILLRRALPPRDLRQEVPRKVRLQGLYMSPWEATIDVLLCI